jgi:ABC-type antimicrobial peptide transport system permease subunit
MNISYNLKNSFSAYKQAQNIQDFSFLARADLGKSDIDRFYKENKDVWPNHVARINTYYNLIDDKAITAAKRENYREDAMFAMANYADVLPFRYASADVLAKKYNFTYESEYFKDIVQKVNGVQHAFRFIPYNPANKINKPLLLAGRFPQKPGEITMFPEYMKANHYKIGDAILIRGNTYTIVGMYHAPNFIFPKIDVSSVFFESKKQTLVLSMPSDFFAIKNLDMECYLVGTFNDKSTDVTKAVRRLANDPQSSYSLTYLENLSIGGGLFTMLNAFDATSYGILAAFAIISMLIVSFVVRKKLNEDRKKLGILLSLGYNRSAIAWSYVIYGALAGLSAILGFGFAMLLKSPVTNAIKGYFILPSLHNGMDFWLLLISFVVMTTAIGAISVGMAFRVLQAKPVELINPSENEHVNAIARWIGKLMKQASFINRFKYTLASRSLGKLIAIVLLTTLCGVLISAIFISSNFFPALEKNFANYKYDYAVTYNNGLLQTDPTNGLQTGDTVMIDVKGTIDEVNGVRTLNNKSSDGEFLHIMGIDITNTTYPIYDMKGKLIHTRNDGLIVTSSFLLQFHAKIGDIITITPKSKYDYRFQIPIVGLSSNFTDGPGVFLDRAFLNEKLGNDPLNYNVRLTKSTVGTDIESFINNSKIVSVVSMADVKHNYKQMSSIAKYIVYLLEAFMALLTMTLIALLSNLVIEENAAKISLLKVMGFTKREVDRMVLNIYTPFILLAIVLSIPIAILLMKTIFYFIFGGYNVAFPIKMTVLQIVLSALTIFVGYLLSLRLNRKALNKIPLTIALKRE